MSYTKTLEDSGGQKRTDNKVPIKFDYGLMSRSAAEPTTAVMPAIMNNSYQMPIRAYHGNASPVFYPADIDSVDSLKSVNINSAELVMYLARIQWIDDLLYFIEPSDGRARRVSSFGIEALVTRVLHDTNRSHYSPEYITRLSKLILMHPFREHYVERDEEQIMLCNGRYKFRTGEFIKQKPINHAITANLNANYLPYNRADCPAFDDFLQSISGGDETLIRRVWQVIGYLLTPDQDASIFVLFQGLSGTGKSVLADIISYCFYPEDVSSVDISSLTKPATLKDIVGKRLLVNAELPDSAISPKVIKVLKQLVGGDSLTADHPDLRRQKITFYNSAKVLLCTNYPLGVLDLDETLCRRIVMVPFGFKPNIIDRKLKEKLLEEKDAIVTKALQSYKDLANNDYCFSGEFYLDDVVEFPRLLDSCIFQFIKTKCCQKAGSWTSTQMLQDAFFSHYGVECSVKLFAAKFNQACRCLGYHVRSGRSHVNIPNAKRGWYGIELRYDIDKAK